MEGLLDRRLSGLSGGQSQRICTFRAVVSKPRVLIFDGGAGRAAARCTELERNAHVTPSALLLGKVFDETGEGLEPTHTTWSGKRLTHYVPAASALEAIVAGTHPLGLPSEWIKRQNLPAD